MGRLIHPVSKDCMVDELAIFEVPCTQTSLEGNMELELKPVSPLIASSELIEFRIPAEGGQYIDLSSVYLSLNVQILDSEGIALADDAKVSIVNNFLHSLFSQVDIEVNGRRVSPPMKTYPYKAYIHTLFGYRRSAKDNFLSIVPWLKDEGEKDKPNYKRMSAYDKKLPFDVAGHLLCDIFMQEKFILSTADIDIKLYRSDQGFAIVSETGARYQVRIHDASLFVRKYQVCDIVLNAHNLAMKRGTAKYPINRTEVKAYPVTGSIMSCSLDNAYHGELPRRLIIGMVDEDAFNGLETKNPFNFKHNNLKNIIAVFNGKMYPSKPYKMHFDKKSALKPYWDLFSNTGQLKDKNPSLDITFSEFLNGFTFFAFNFTPDLSDASSGHVNLLKRGNLRLEFEFYTKLADPIVIILFSEFDSLIEIDSSSNVVADF
jgi:hypothetical protein